VLAMIFHQRAWCAICPIGSLSSWVGRNKYPLTVDQDKCIECGACEKICPMQLAPAKLREGSMATRGDCLKCGLCVAACGKEALTFGRSE
jgi:ferredoxin-type protein NapH